MPLTRSEGYIIELARGQSTMNLMFLFEWVNHDIHALGNMSRVQAEDLFDITFALDDFFGTFNNRHPIRLVSQQRAEIIIERRAGNALEKRMRYFADDNRPLVAFNVGVPHFDVVGIGLQPPIPYLRYRLA